LYCTHCILNAGCRTCILTVWNAAGYPEVRTEMVMSNTTRALEVNIPSSVNEHGKGHSRQGEVACIGYVSGIIKDVALNAVSSLKVYGFKR
jgi:hypothetical protein